MTSARFTSVRYWVAAVGLMILFAAPAHAHIRLLAPNGGEELEVGTVVTVRWQIEIQHNQQNWDIWYSKTGPGGPWIVVAMDLPPGDFGAGSVHTYEWTIPYDLTSRGRVRVRMDNAGTDYEDVSNADFSIVSTPLTGFTMIDGFIVAGGLPEIRGSDDTYLETEAKVTGEAAETHRLQLRVRALTEVENAETIDIKFEARITDIEATVTLFLRNFGTGNFEEVGRFTNGMQESVNMVNVPNASRFVRNADGRIVLHVKKIVVLPFTLNGFHSLIDQVEIVVR